MRENRNQRAGARRVHECAERHRRPARQGPADDGPQPGRPRPAPAAAQCAAPGRLRRPVGQGCWATPCTSRTLRTPASRIHPGASIPSTGAPCRPGVAEATARLDRRKQPGLRRSRPRPLPRRLALRRRGTQQQPDQSTGGKGTVQYRRDQPAQWRPPPARRPGAQRRHAQPGEQDRLRDRPQPRHRRRGSVPQRGAGTDPVQAAGRAPVRQAC